MPSDVFLIRHAAAVSATATLRDGQRHLSELGREQARELGDRLRWHDCEPTHIWTSPLVRAVQTAELVARGVRATCTIESVPGLASGEPPSLIVDMINEMPEDALVMLFGHQPTISMIGALLTRNDEFAALRNAEAVRIHHGRVRWRFAWDAEAPTTKV